MPLYKITTPDGLLSSEAKAALAAEITEFHSQMSGLDEAYTKILFNSFPPGDGFIGREAGPAVILTVKVRAGRPADYRSKLLFGLKSLLQRATGAADVQMLLALKETPASNAIESKKCAITNGGERSTSTVTPPRTICASTPATRPHESQIRSRRRGTRAC